MEDYIKQYVGEFIEISESKESVYSRKRFALPVFDENGEVLRYNVFHAELIIRHSKDDKLYLYDIINIKKETGTPLES